MHEGRHLFQQHLRDGQPSTQAEVHCQGKSCLFTAFSVGGIRMQRKSWIAANTPPVFLDQARENISFMMHFVEGLEYQGSSKFYPLLSPYAGKGADD